MSANSKPKPVHIFGEILFDHFPDGNRVLGGAPFNVAWHLQAFGLAPRFISRVGNDAEGEEIKGLMKNWGMQLDDLQNDHHHQTGLVRVTLKGNEPHYEIVPDCAYDFVDATQLDNITTQGILYHGSLAVRNPASNEALKTLKSRHQGLVFVDVNLRPPWWQRETLLPLLCDADWVKLNEDELFQLSQKAKSNASELKALMNDFCNEFELETLIVTCGERGALAINKDGEFLSNKPNLTQAVVDTVGAGDAFAAVMMLGLAKGWTLSTSLLRAQTFASVIVGNRGATVNDKTFYQAEVQWH